MRILMVGAGAVGGYVGGRLVQAGREVDFLVRPGRAAQLAGHGLRIADGEHTDVIDASIVTAPDLSGRYDLVLVGVKAEALPDAMNDFKPAVGPDTAVLPFLNGVRHIETLVDTFGSTPVLGGTLKIVAQLDAGGMIRQLLPGGAIELGELDATASRRIAEITEELTIPGFTVSTPPDITDAMWSKWVFIATIGAVTSLAHGTVGEVVATIGGAAFADETLAEAASVARAAGHSLNPQDYAATRAIATAEHAPFTSSLSRDLITGRPTEVESVLGDLINTAREFGLAVPRLEAAALVLRAHNARNTAV